MRQFIQCLFSIVIICLLANSAISMAAPPSTATVSQVPNGKQQTRHLMSSLVGAEFDLQKYQTLIEQMQTQLANRNFSDYELNFYRSQLLLISQNLNDIAGKTQQQLEREQKLLKTLEIDATKNKELDVTKDAFILARVKEYKSKIADSQLRLLKLKYFQSRIDIMTKRIYGLRMESRKQQALKRNKPLYFSGTWHQAYQQTRLLSTQGVSIEKHIWSRQRDRHALMLLFTMLVGFLVYQWIIGIRLRKRLTKSNSADKKFKCFNLSFILRGLVPGLVFYCIGENISDIVGGFGSMAFYEAIFRAIGFFMIASGVIRSALQVYTAGKTSAKIAVGKASLLFAAAWFSIFIFINNVDIFAFLSLTFLRFNPDIVALVDFIWSVVFIVVAWCILYRIKPKQSAASGNKHFVIRICVRYFTVLRTIVMVILVIYPVLLLFGFINFANNIIINAMQTVIVIALFDWLHTLAKFYLPTMNANLKGYYLTRVKHQEPAPEQEQQQQQNKNKLLNYWLLTCVDVVLLLALIVMVVLIWGLHYEVLLDWVDLIFVKGIPIGKNATFSLSHLLRAVVMFLAIFWITRFIQYILDKRVLSYMHMDFGTKHAVKTTVGYVGLIFAIVMFVYSLGINVTTLTFIISGLSVGIGIGLQDFFKNFFAGMILLIERPVKVGDMVIVNNDYGIIKKIRLRATEVETFNKTTFIIPNSDFVIKPISNETINPISRADINIGISYDNDPKQAMQILLDVAKRHPKVLADPESIVMFNDFADSSLALQLRVFTLTGDRAAASSELRLMILEAFREAGIEIPYPQSDIYVKEFTALKPIGVVKVDPQQPLQSTA